MPDSGTGASATTELAAIYVAVMGERSGQLLRQALQRRFDGPGLGVAKKYELTGGLGVSGEAIAIQRDTSSTRTRLIGTATWVLRVFDLQHTLLTNGTARVLDGYNILDQQYFAADLQNEAAVRRIAESLADQIAQQLAIFLKRRAAEQKA